MKILCFPDNKYYAHISTESGTRSAGVEYQESFMIKFRDSETNVALSEIPWLVNQFISIQKLDYPNLIAYFNLELMLSEEKFKITELQGDKIIKLSVYTDTKIGSVKIFDCSSYSEHHQVSVDVIMKLYTQKIALFKRQLKITIDSLEKDLKVNKKNHSLI